MVVELNFRDYNDNLLNYFPVKIINKNDINKRLNFILISFTIYLRHFLIKF